MFGFIKRKADETIKLIKQSYDIEYPYSDYSNTSYSLMPIDGITLSRYKMDEHEPITIPAFTKISIGRKDYIPGASLISYNNKDVVIPTIVYEKAIVRCRAEGKLKIDGPDGIVEWPMKGIYDSWYSYEENDGFFGVTLPLIAIFRCAHKEAVRSFAHGIMDVLKQYNNIKDEIHGYDRSDVQKEISKLVKGVYNTIEEIGGFMDFSDVKSVEECLAEKDEQDKIEREKERIAEEAKKARYNDFMEQIRGRQELLKQFNGKN